MIAKGSEEDTSSGGDGEGMFVVGEEAVQALRKFDGPIAIVAIVGLYRTGKSYLVNRIVGQQHGFTVGPTVNVSEAGRHEAGSLKKGKAALPLSTFLCNHLFFSKPYSPPPHRLVLACVLRRTSLFFK